MGVVPKVSATQGVSANNADQSVPERNVPNSGGSASQAVRKSRFHCILVY